MARGEAVARLRGSHDVLIVQKAPFDEPRELAASVPSGLEFPAFGDLAIVDRLPSSPWAFVSAPDAVELPEPAQ